MNGTETQTQADLDREAEENAGPGTETRGEEPGDPGRGETRTEGAGPGDPGPEGPEPEGLETASPETESPETESLETGTELETGVTIILSTTGRRATIGVKRDGADAFIAAFENQGMDQLVLEAPEALERARSHWAESPMYPTYNRPKPARAKKGQPGFSPGQGQEQGRSDGAAGGTEPGDRPARDRPARDRPARDGPAGGTGPRGGAARGGPVHAETVLRRGQCRTATPETWATSESSGCSARYASPGREYPYPWRWSGT